MYGISLLLAAIKFSLMFSNSEISLTTTLDRFFLKKTVRYKRKLGPCVPQYIYWMTIDFSFNSASFLHQSYHCGMLLWCQMTNKGTITRVQGLWLRFVWHDEIVVHSTSWSGQYFFSQARLQYFTILHSEHCNNFTLSNWTWPVPLHWWNL